MIYGVDEWLIDFPAPYQLINIFPILELLISDQVYLNFRLLLFRTFGIVAEFPTTKIQQHFALFSRQKFDSASPQIRHRAKNTILTKLSAWEYGNSDAPFSWQKYGRVLRLVCYSASVGFRICVYDAYQHARTMMSRSLSKHQACWCVSYTWGNQCHLVAWIKTITLRSLCTQYNMNMHLQQSPWAHTHTTSSRALMTEEGYSRSHESPS